MPDRAGIGWRIYGLGVIALGLVALAFGGFDPGQPVPANIARLPLLAPAIAVFMVGVGVGVEWRRTTAWAAAALTVYYGVVVVGLMYGRAVLRHGSQFGTYSSAAEQLAIAAGGLVIYASAARIAQARALRLMRLGRGLFGLCALLFGGAHFVYMGLTVPLVPKWLPPSPEFWAWATGLGHIAAGLAILTGIQARLAAVLLTAMYVAFTLLVHGPMLAADPSSHWIWGENALNMALIGVAWTVADSLAPPANAHA